MICNVYTKVMTVVLLALALIFAVFDIHIMPFNGVSTVTRAILSFMLVYFCLNLINELNEKKNDLLVYAFNILYISAIGNIGFFLQSILYPIFAKWFATTIYLIIASCLVWAIFRFIEAFVNKVEPDLEKSESV